MVLLKELMNVNKAITLREFLELSPIYLNDAQVAQASDFIKNNSVISVDQDSEISDDDEIKMVRKPRKKNKKE